MFGQSVLDSLPVEGRQVDDVREVGREPDELEDVANLGCRESVDVVQDDVRGPR